MQRTFFNVQIGTSFLCSCSSSTVANRKTCCHIVWVLHNVFSVEKSNSVLAQIEISRKIFDEMRESLPHELPESVTQCENGRTLSPKLKNHPKFETEQIWYLSATESGVQVDVPVIWYQNKLRLVIYICM